MTDLATLPVLLQAFEDCLTEAACAKDVGTARAAVARGMQVSAIILKNFPDHYQGYHTLGVLWYHHPDKTPERSAKAKELLKRALELNPASQFSIQYLAYIHFDERDYRTALAYYQQTDRAYFENEGQHWRWLKAWESSIACRVHLTPESLSPDEIREFISAYREAEARDESPAVQWELWRSLRMLNAGYRAHYATIIEEVRNFITSTGNAFVLQEEPNQSPEPARGAVH